MWSKRGPAECCDLDWLESTGHFLDEFDESTSNLTAHFERADELFPRWIFIINPVWIKFWLVRLGCNLKITHKFFNKVVSSFVYHFCNLWSALPVSNTLVGLRFSRLAVVYSSGHMDHRDPRLVAVSCRRCSSIRREAAWRGHLQ